MCWGDLGMDGYISCWWYNHGTIITNSQTQGYWAQDIEAVNSNFGTANDLIALSNALHARGMYLMLDVVTNHFACTGALLFAHDSSIQLHFDQAGSFYLPLNCSILYDSSTPAGI